MGAPPRRPGPQQSPLRRISDPLAISTDTNENCLAPARPLKVLAGAASPKNPPDPYSAPQRWSFLPVTPAPHPLPPHPPPHLVVQFHPKSTSFSERRHLQIAWGTSPPPAAPARRARGRLTRGGRAEACSSRLGLGRPGNLSSRRWGGARGGGAPAPPPTLGAVATARPNLQARLYLVPHHLPGTPLLGAPPPSRPPGRGSEPRRAAPPRVPWRPHLRASGGPAPRRAGKCAAAGAPGLGGR